ncbi:MAG: Gfo/Idh/MocA family protein [Roseiflexaceae bacterium]
MSLRVGIIGCGRPWRSDGATGFGMSHQHAFGYRETGKCEIVALADVVAENAQAFAAIHGPGANIYTDYNEMLAKENLDIVSISTWPHLHAPMVIDAANAKVRAIHCEKPMAPTFGESKRMVAAAEANGVQLTFNHQRRFGTPFRAGKKLLDEGRIGTLERIEAVCDNMYDWGTHWIDMACYFNDETDAEWVIGQVDLRDPQMIFGVPCERHGFGMTRFKNGVTLVMNTGYQAGPRFGLRMIGTDGIIDVGVDNQTHLRVKGKGDSDWVVIPDTEGLHGDECVKRGVADLVDALLTGREPELAGRRSLRATEIIFATYESARSRGRIDLPLTSEDSALISMLGLK